MKKLAVLSTALGVAIFAMSSQATSTPAKEEKPKTPPVSAQVAKLMALYPQLITRIEPRGKVCFDGVECDINISVLAPAVEGQARDGESIYKAICQTCHGTGLLQAPKFGDAGAWGARLGKGKDTLYHNAINGINAMPARGGNPDISDEEVKNAVDYMLNNSK